MDRVYNGNAGIFIPVVQKNTFETWKDTSLKDYVVNQGT